MKKKFRLSSIVFFIGIIFICRLPAMGQMNGDFRENQTKAFAASSTSECQSSLKFCNRVLKVIPNHPIMNYLAARLNAQLGNSVVAFNHLKKAIRLGYTTKLPFKKIHLLNDPAFDSLRGKKEFQEILNILKQSEKHVHNSKVAFTISDKDFLPEGIAYDPVDKVFYLGSETKQKIVKVDFFGNSTDFVKIDKDGLNLVFLGVHVDPVRRTLWACMFDKTRRGVFKYDLSSGKLLKTYIEPPSSKCGFNDLVIHPNGDVYIADSSRSAIYMIPHSTDKLELFLKNESIISPNGITLSDDGQTIYLADIKIGIYKIDIKTKAFFLLSHESDFSPMGIDGLYFANNKLYAVQILLNQISRFYLNKGATHIEKTDILERNGPYLNKPTTGVIVDDYFYFIADTQGKGKNPGGIIVMKTPIK